MITDNNKISADAGLLIIEMEKQGQMIWFFAVSAADKKAFEKAILKLGTVLTMSCTSISKTSFGTIS